MTSTFTTHLALEIPAHGDYATSGWDVPMDNTLNQLDTAYGGQLNLAVSGGTTVLTPAQASYPVINVTGSLSTNQAIVFPATVAGRRLIIPACTMNAFALYVRGGGGADTIGVYFWTNFGVPYGIVVTGSRVFWDYGAVGPGSIIDVPFAFPGNGWLPLDGRYVAMQQHDLLWDLIGGGYGQSGTFPTGAFALPDMRGTVLAMADQIGAVPAAPSGFSVNMGSAGRLNSWGLFGGLSGGGTLYAGESNHTLLVTEMPSHTHDQTPHAHLITDVQHEHPYQALVPGAGPWGAGLQGAGLSTFTGPSYSGIEGTLPQLANIAAAGGSLTHNNVQPTVTTMKMIKW